MHWAPHSLAQSFLLPWLVETMSARPKHCHARPPRPCVIGRFSSAKSKWISNQSSTSWDSRQVISCVAFVQGDNPSAHASGLKRCLIQLSTSCQPGPRAPEGADWEQAQALQVRLHCCACMPLSVSYKTERGPAAAPAWFAIRLLQYLSKSKLLLQIPLKSTSIAPKAQR